MVSGGPDRSWHRAYARARRFGGGYLDPRPRLGRTRFSPCDAASRRHPGRRRRLCHAADDRPKRWPAAPAGELAIRQFDVHRESGSMLAFDRGWYEDEYDPATGLRWRWSSDRSDLFVVAGAGTTLVLRGESPLKYFDEPPIVPGDHGCDHPGRVQTRRGLRVAHTHPARHVPSSGGVVTVSLDRAYLPGTGRGHVGYSPTWSSHLRCDARRGLNVVFGISQIDRWDLGG